MKTYSIDVQLAATLYIRAESQEDAQRQLDEFELAAEIEWDVYGGDFENIDAGDPKLSPAMTYVGPYPDLKLEEA